MSSPYLVSSWFQLPFYLMRVGLEAQSLMGIRLFRMTTGRVPSLAEAGHLVSEKAKVVRLSGTRAKANKKRPRKRAETR